MKLEVSLLLQSISALMEKIAAKQLEILPIEILPDEHRDQLLLLFAGKIFNCFYLLIYLLF